MLKFNEKQKEYIIKRFSSKGMTKNKALVCFYILSGLSNKKIADKLCVTEKTIKFHLTHSKRCPGVFSILKIDKRSQIFLSLEWEEWQKIIDLRIEKEEISEKEVKKEENFQYLPTGKENF